MTDTAEWEAHLSYSLGFVARNEEEARGVLALFPDEDAIDGEYGDCQPREIVVVRGSAKPVPQSPGSEHLRLHGSHYVRDSIEIVRDFEDVEDAETALLMYEAALGAAERLNRVTQPAAVKTR